MRRIDAGLWCVEQHFVRWGCRGSVRMTVIETETGLLLYSPVALTPDTIAELRDLGPVGGLLAPNLYHHMFLRPAHAAFPSARVLVPPGLDAKIGAIPGAQILTDQTPLGTNGDIAHFVFSGHALHETVLYHRPTATLITADLLYNYGPRQYPAERAFFRAIGCYGAPKVAFYHRFAIRDKASVRDLIAWVSGLRIRRIIMSHGDIVEADDAGQRFIAAWQRFAT